MKNVINFYFKFGKNITKIIIENFISFLVPLISFRFRLKSISN